MEFDHTPLSKKKIILVIVVVLLVFGNIFFGIEYVVQRQETQKLQKEIVAQQTNVKVVNFLNLFIAKVLESNTTVSFDDRLQLENAVRDINDPEILAKWEQFTGGTDEVQVQQGVKDLLRILVKKIS